MLLAREARERLMNNQILRQAKIEMQVQGDKVDAGSRGMGLDQGSRMGIDSKVKEPSRLISIQMNVFDGASPAAKKARQLHQQNTNCMN